MHPDSPSSVSDSSQPPKPLEMPRWTSPDRISGAEIKTRNQISSLKFLFWDAEVANVNLLFLEKRIQWRILSWTWISSYPWVDSLHRPSSLLKNGCPLNLYPRKHFISAHPMTPLFFQEANMHSERGICWSRFILILSM